MRLYKNNNYADCRSAILFIVNHCFNLVIMVLVACHGTIHGTKCREVYMTLRENLMQIREEVRAKYAQQKQ